MKLLDRILVIRHAIIVACKPSTETTMICVHDKNSKKISYIFFGDFEKSESLYIDYWKGLFIHNANDSKSLKTKLIRFNKKVQDDWNKNNRCDPLRLIKTETTVFKTPTNDRKIISNIFQDKQITITRLLKVILLSLEDAFIEVYPDDKWYLYTISKYVNKFYGKLDYVFYTANGLESDRDFAISVGTQSFAYVLFLARKKGEMASVAFKSLPIYYKIKMVNEFINVKTEGNPNASDILINLKRGLNNA